MDAMFSKGRLLLLGGTNSERRRARLDEHGGLYFRARDISGVKIMDVAVVEGGKVVGSKRTPYGLKKVRRNRRANKIARKSRKGNR